jgi:hypothetical protein
MHILDYVQVIWLPSKKHNIQPASSHQIDTPVPSLEDVNDTLQGSYDIFLMLDRASELST